MRSLASRDRSAEESGSAVARLSMRRDAWQPAAVVAGVVVTVWDATATAGWLVAGGACWGLASGRWRTPVCAWLAPVLLLHVTRVEGLWPGLLLVWLALVVATGVANHGVLPLPPLVYWLLMGGVYGAVLLPAYAVDGVLAPRLTGVASTLVFPLTWAVVEHLAMRFNAIGSWSAVAYTQYGHTPLLQLVSVTGLGGVTFLIGWFAATANWIWDEGLMSAAGRRGLAFAAVLIADAALAGRSPVASTSRVTGDASAQPAIGTAGGFDRQSRAPQTCSAMTRRSSRPFTTTGDMASPWRRAATPGCGGLGSAARITCHFARGGGSEHVCRMVPRTNSDCRPASTDRIAPLARSALAFSTTALEAPGLKPFWGGADPPLSSRSLRARLRRRSAQPLGPEEGS